MTRFLVVSDSFKGSLSSALAGRAIAAGIRMAAENAAVHVFPAADGGEGTAEALDAALGGKSHHYTVSDPFGFPVRAPYSDLGLRDGLRTAVFDMASCAGLGLARLHGTDPLVASTYGVGEMLIALCRAGFHRIYIGLGGSGTNDGGAGALSAMGARFTADDDTVIGGPIGGGMLSRIADVDLAPVHALLSGVEVCLLYDVALPLYGEKGASRMFAPQKGANSAAVESLEYGIRHFAKILCARYPQVDPQTDGCGAAGGLGFGLYAVGGVPMVGADTVLRVIGYPDMLREDCTLVFTGEGRTDLQTIHGKLPSVVARYAQTAGIPCVDLCGSAAVLPDRALYDCGMTAIFPILQEPLSLAESMAITAEELTKTAYNVTRLWLARHDTTKYAKTRP